MVRRESIGVSHSPSYPRVNIGSVWRDYRVRTRYTWRGAVIIRPQRNESIRINLRVIIYALAHKKFTRLFMALLNT